MRAFLRFLTGDDLRLVNQGMLECFEKPPAGLHALVDDEGEIIVVAIERSPLFFYAAKHEIEIVTRH